MKCANCGLINPDTATRCDCGYDFEVPVQALSNQMWNLSERDTVVRDFAICGGLVFLFFLVAFGFFADVDSPGGRVLLYPGVFVVEHIFTINPHNVGIILVFGCALVLDVFVYGSILLGVWRVLRIIRSGT